MFVSGVLRREIQYLSGVMDALTKERTEGPFGHEYCQTGHGSFFWFA
jgi:hypothetical protein